ncbi:MAG: DivIVA domain-containing protein [Actinomycetota bacterium]
MAISFSRPDPSSPAAVGSAAFPVTKRGFDQGEVRDFLRMVAAELARLQEREKFLESEMRAMQTRGLSVPGRLDEETVTTLLGEEAARVLTVARDASTQIRERAEEQATRLVKEAAEDAARIREAAMLEAVRIRDDAVSDAENEIEMAKQQGREMVNEAREYREKVLSELSRRREAARAQIEHLLHGRDRLLTAFQRARGAADSALDELTDAHDDPEFIVDLAPAVPAPVAAPVISPEHPSVTVFDDEIAGEPAESRTGVTVTHDEVGEPIIDIPLDEVTGDDSLEAIVEEIVHDIVEHEVEVVAPETADPVVPAPTETVSHPVHGEPAASDSDSGGSAPMTNVVSLFGRKRKSHDAEAPTPVAADTPVEKPVEKTPDAKAPAAVDDIFARLRAGSTAAVTDKIGDATTKGTHGTTMDAPAPAPAAPAMSGKKSPKKKQPAAPAATVADPAAFAARNEALAGLVTSMARKLKRVLADEQNNVLAHLRQKRASLEIDAILGTATDQATAYAKAIAEESMSAASAGAASVKSAGGSTKRVTQKAIDATVLETIAAGLVAAFREEARVAIGEAEGDRDVLSGLMRDVYRAWKMDSIDTHVDDIACAAHVRGAYLALEAGAAIGWMVDPTHACCSECEDNSLAGAIGKGTTFPTGHEHPIAHAGCKCLIRPVRH